jgi:hypothetical protein
LIPPKKQGCRTLAELVLQRRAILLFQTGMGCSEIRTLHKGSVGNLLKTATH